MDHVGDLYRMESGVEPHPGVLIVALDGFMDAGSTQQLLVEHLLGAGEADVVATFDVDQLVDYRGRRPMMTFDQNRWTEYAAPQLQVFRLRDREGQVFYVLTGPEPDYRWEKVVKNIQDLSERLGITLTVSAHGIPMGVPHTRPIGLTMHGTEPRLLGNASSMFGTVQVPGSLSALLEMRIGEAGGAALGISVHIPHYLAQASYPDGALTALNAIADATGLNLPNDHLVESASSNRADIAREVAGSEQVQEVISALERQYDSSELGQNSPTLLAAESAQLPSADEIGAEFEEFLRSVSDGES